VEQFIQESGKTVQETDKEINSGPMDHATKVNGATIKPMVTVNYITRTKTSTRVNGLTTKPMGKASTHIPTVPDTMESGKMINNMDWESSLGRMELYMKEW